ncbi:hypothetical protein GCM10027290_59050 [Micromonospora sonneratiae]|uniref:DUF2637 domain-containing protein n=1 Tax=Micromonospora sonneratiae TaxID=1184706 RepID=A0ABW3Y8Q0_9ACTN
MTAPTINGTRYPQPVEDLLPKARKLTQELGDLPSRNRLMRDYRIGAAKADDLLDRLRNERARQERVDGIHAAMVVRGSLAERVELFPADSGTDAENPAPVRFDYTEPIGPDPVPVPVVPGSAPVVVPGPPPTVADPPAAVLPLVAGDGHPGSNITTDTDEKMPSAVAGRSARVAGRGWAYAGVILGGVVSIAANVAHTYLPKPPPGAPAGWVPDPDWSPSPLAVAFSVFWPIALFVAVEILTRIPWDEGFRWFVARLVGVLPVAIVAAVVSYRHLAGLLEHFGEDPLTTAIGPLAIDGLMVMASAALMATSRKTTTK